MNEWLPYALPADLPEDWTADQLVPPNGPDIGLPEQYGYNYLCKQINKTQKAVMALQAVMQCCLQRKEMETQRERPS